LKKEFFNNPLSWRMFKSAITTCPQGWYLNIELIEIHVCISVIKISMCTVNIQLIFKYHTCTMATKATSKWFVDNLIKISCYNTLLQLYLGGQFYSWWKPEYLEKTNNQSQFTDKLHHIMLCRVHLVKNGVFKLTTLVVIGKLN